MAEDDTKLVPKPEARLVEAIPEDGDARHILAYNENRNIADMTPTHAEAVRAVAELQYAVPAREETKRHAMSVAEGNKRHRWTLGVVGATVAALILKSWPENTPPALFYAIAVIITVLGAGEVATTVIKEWKKKKGGDDK